MILSVLITSLLAAPPCAISGTVELLRNGKKIEAGDQVALYIDHVPAAAYKRVAATHDMRQINKEFVPHVMVVTVGDEVTFNNDDKVEHSVFSNADTTHFEFPASKKGLTGIHVFNDPGPVRIQCDIHSKMRADVLVVANPFATLARPGGSFRISGLPADNYTLVAWEPNGGETHLEVSCGTRPETVVRIKVEESPKPKLLRKDGEEYREYP